MADASGSFIPQQNVLPRNKNKRVRRRVYIISYLIYIFFFGTLLVVAGVTLWGVTQEGTLANLQTTLADQRRETSPDQIANIVLTNNRLRLAEDLLNRLPATSKLFFNLEDSVVATNQITGFSIRRGDATSPNSVLVSFTGQAADFNAVRFQRDVLSQNPVYDTATVESVTYGRQSTDPANPNVIAYTVSVAVPVSDIQYDGLTEVPTQIFTPTLEAAAAQESTVTFDESADVPGDDFFIEDVPTEEFDDSSDTTEFNDDAPPEPVPMFNPPSI